VKKLFLVPLVAAVAWFAVRGAPVEGQRIFNLTLEALATIGPLMAASTFDRGDYLRRAWLCFGAAAAFLFLAQLSRFWTGPSNGMGWIRVGAIFLSNTATSVGSILFARTAGKAGLELPGSKLSRGGGYVISVGIALLFAVPALLQPIQHFSTSRLPGGLVPFFATIGDATSLALIAPILMTALALRGGLIAWPWIFLTCGELSWLIFDAAIAVIPDDAPAWLQDSATCFRMAAFAFTFAAGLAQKRVSSIQEG
jgi:hypothetical protein